MSKLLRCKTCGKIFKIVKEDGVTPDYIKRLHTDMGGIISVYSVGNYMKCVCCNELSQYETINTDDWIIDLVYKVKGN